MVTTIGSNALSVQPVGTVKQWKRGKGSVNVSQPHASKVYNKCVGGVDLVDRTLSDLRPSFSGKKWYRSLIINALNLGFVYCWRLHQLCTKPKGDQKSFHRAVGQVAFKFPSSSSQTRSKFRHSRWSTIWRQRTLPSTRTSDKICLVQEELSQCVWKM